ncbi:unnamed protein product [Oppiella nova]|uniref:Tudor domain-containing protein n=1 Tax=Oppiella nova TaxID=334625 RepID=A0A7R9L928_9ACAR|nr:unnamed protein product [Oppiella nova]CAG2159963.1 unnamed protein product [Oppiella nova]
MDVSVGKPKIMRCHITHVCVSGRRVEVWAQSDVMSCLRVERQLTAYHKHLSDSFAATSLEQRPALEPNVGDFYLTRLTNDLHFARVVVTDVDVESSRAQVLAMDFGTEESVPFKHLVSFDRLFTEPSLAHKYYLADITPKDKEWDSERVRKCLKPYIFGNYLCEVVKITKNTECVRIYDQLFEQPLVRDLIKQCAGVVSYDTSTDHLEAIDLTITKNTECVRIYDQLFEQPLVRDLIKQCAGVVSYDTSTDHLEAIDLTVNCDDINDKSNPLRVYNKYDSEVVVKYLKANSSDMKPMDKSSRKADTKRAIVGQIGSQMNGDIPGTDKCALNVESIPKEPLNGFEGHKPAVDLKVNETEPVVESDVGTEDSNGLKGDSSDENVDQIAAKVDTFEPQLETIDLKINTNNEKVDEIEAKEDTIEENKDTNKSTVETMDSNLNEIEPIVETIDHKVNGNSLKVDDLSGDTRDSCNKTLDSRDCKQVDTTNDTSNLADNSSLNESNGKPHVNINDLEALVLTQKEIYVSCGHSIKSFHCQLSSKFDDITCLSSLMTDFYNRIKNSSECSLNLKALAINDIIASQYSEDQLWYRAAVKAIDGNKLDVLYIDYGNDETVDVSKCKALAPQFQAMKPQAYLCSLVDDIPQERLHKVDSKVRPISETRPKPLVFFKREARPGP